jgi:hypothetical protein
MPRIPTLLLLAGALAAVGCRTFEDRAGLFPRLRDRLDPDDDHRQPDYRFADRGPYTHIPYQQPYPSATAGGCVPCSGGAVYPGGGMTLGTPTVGGGYAMPLGYTHPPGLGQPVYPSGDGSPYRPRRDDELPLPGGYSQPGAVEMGRGTAPKPPGTLAGGK